MAYAAKTNTETLPAGTIIATCNDTGTQTYTVPSYTFTAPASGFSTWSLWFAYRQPNGNQLTATGFPGLILLPSTTIPTTQPFDTSGALKIRIWTSIAGVICSSQDVRRMGGVGSNNIIPGSITTTHLSSGLLTTIASGGSTTLGADTDIDWLSVGVGKVLAAVTSRGKSYSFITMTANPTYALCIDASDSTNGNNLTTESGNLLLTN